MRKHLFIFLFPLFLATLLTPYVLGSQQDRFWLLSRGAKGGEYLTQMDVLGRVTVAPTRILNSLANSTFAALSEDENGVLIIWANPPNGFIDRILVRKSNLQILKITATNQRSLGPISTTNKTEGNSICFLAHTEKGRQLVSYSTNDSGAISGPRRTLSPPINCLGDVTNLRVCGGGISSDGRTVFYSTFDDNTTVETLYVQALGNSGNPTSKWTKVDSLSSANFHILKGIEAGESQPGLKSFLYEKHVVEPGSINKLYIQPLDPVTSAPLSTKIRISSHSYVDESDQALMDPRGRFLIFNVARYPNPSPLYYQALDPTGHPSGRPRLIDESMGFSEIQDLTLERP